MVITDPSCGEGREIVEVVRAALRGGAGAVQLRGKEMTGREMVELGQRLRSATREAGALLFVNDRVDVALAIDADGAHVGDADLPLTSARRITPSSFLLGRSVDGLDSARAAELEDADYLGVGPVYGTPSKLDAGPAIGLGPIRAIRAATTLPLVAIGGIDAGNAADVADAGADGVAVIRAIMQAADPAEAVRSLLGAVHAARRLAG